MKQLNEQTIKRLQKLAGISEIKISSPLMEFNVDIKEDGEVEYFVWAIQNGDNYFGMNDDWSPITYKLTIGPVNSWGGIEVKETYKVMFYITVGVVNTGTKVSEQQADALEEMAKKNHVQYERGTYESGFNYMHFFLDKHLINTSLYVNGIPFRNLTSKA